MHVGRLAESAVNEDQYRSLCEACDRALLAPDTTIERVAIPLLHIIREHPMLLMRYAELFEPISGIKEVGRRLFRAVRNQAAWYRQLLRSARTRGACWFGPQTLSKQIDVLLVSHLLNANFAGREDDFYYGDLPKQLTAQGHSVVIALINYSGEPGATLVEKWGNEVVPRVIFTSSLSAPKEQALHRRLCVESIRLKRLASSAKGLYRKVLIHAAQDARSGGALFTLRLGEQIGALVSELKPKAIVVTHEGHAWERVAFSVARNTLPAIRCIGYQHAALFRLQHAIQRSLAPNYNPDTVLTAGVISKTKLEQAPGLPGISVSVLGSNRSFKLGLDQCVHKSEKSGGDNKNPPTCMVLPEGFASECHLLFEFSLACAQALPEVRFIWRLHPSMTHKALATQNPALRNLPRNIVLSATTLEEDTVRSHSALYRGTTAIVQAVVAGLRPIYFQRAGEMSIDPLFELGAWRAQVSDVSEFRYAIYQNIHAHDYPSDTDISNAKEYCEYLFTPLNISALTAYIP